MLKRLLSIALAIMLFAVAAVPTLAAAPLTTEAEARALALVKDGATRAEFAQHIYSALTVHGVLPKSAQFNEIADGSLRDIPRDAPYSDAVYALYRAGILVADDVFNRFFPERKITEKEAVVILARAKDEPSRRYVSLDRPFAAEDIFALASSAVFTIETFDRRGRSIRTGSAFFISADGVAVTCLHVLDEARTAEITLENGDKLSVEGVVAYSEETNVALIKIDGKDFPWLPVMNSDEVKVGAVAYALGTPLELGGTMSKGLVSYLTRQTEDRVMLQFTAGISHGSGGGPLLDAQGRVIGIASSSYTAGETLNLAEPSKHILSLRVGTLRPLSELRR